MPLNAFHQSGQKSLFSNDFLEMTLAYYTKDLKDFSWYPLNVLTQTMNQLSNRPYLPQNYSFSGRRISAGLALFERATHLYSKPRFNIHSTCSSKGYLYDISEVCEMKKPFCTLLHFQKQQVEESHPYRQKPLINNEMFPKVLVVAPYSGHYATLLRDTVSSLLKDHDVWVTDWENARDVPIHQGSFNLENYIQYLFDFVHHIGPNCHMVAVCQPAVPVLAMASLMGTFEDPCAPSSMTLMGGPIDTRASPTKVNVAAKSRSIEWFEKNIIARVPHYYLGAMRRVCPGFLMLSGFMSLNMERHLEANHKLFKHLIQGDEDSVEAHRQFYDEYRSVLDLPADYFIDSIYHAFQNHSIPMGSFYWKGTHVRPQDITRTALLTVEGEKDDISGVGQTHAAHDLCKNLSQEKKQHHLQEGVGHYGVFNGRRWRQSITPIITDFIRRNDQWL